MQVAEAIHSRRSIGKVKPDPVDRALIEQLLEAAVLAPNHHHTEPWRFFVMTGEGRRRLANAYAAVADAKAQSEGKALPPEVRQAQENKAFRAPVVIAAAASPSTDPKIHRAEELAAVHAAMQNMLLTAHSLGLGAMWRSGDPAYHPLMREAFGLGENDAVVGFLYVGYPDIVTPRPPRAHFSEKTEWITG